MRKECDKKKKMRYKRRGYKAKEIKSEKEEQMNSSDRPIL
jgi:hypothetical protein